VRQNEDLMLIPEKNIEIEAKLIKILPGFADYYSDAFRLLSMPEMPTKTHLVSHLFREILSALEAILESIYPIDFINKGTNKHLNKVKHYKTHFKKSNEKMFEYWCKLASDDDFQLHKKAHRDSLNKPRLIDKNYLDFCNNFNYLLKFILENIEINYLQYVEGVNILLKITVPTGDDVDKLRNNFPNNDYLRGYFLGRASKEWLQPLSEKDFFKNPAQPIQTERGNEYPFWAESFYLSRIAAEAPEEVCEIILKIPPTENPRIHFNYFAAAEKMPIENLIKIMEHEKAWLKNSTDFLYLDPSIGKIINRLLLENHAALALECLGYILDFIKIKKDKNSEYSFNKTGAKLNSWDYQELIKQVTENAMASDGLGFLNLFIKLLNQYLNLDMNKGVKPYDNTYISRQDIDHSRFGHGDILDILIDAIINTSIKIIGSDSGKFTTIYELLVQQDWNVFRRIAYYLIEKIQQTEMARMVLTENTLEKLTNPGTWNEIARLLKQFFGEFSENDQHEILNVIENYHDTAWMQDENGNFKEAWDGRKFDKAYETRYLETWRLNKLSIVKDHLEGEWEKKYKSLESKYGKPEHPEYSSYIGEATLGPTSPIGTQEFGEKSIEEQIKCLMDFQPDMKVERDLSWAYEGLARTLQNSVVQKPERYNEYIAQFSVVPLPYIKNIFQAYSELSRNGVHFKWQSLIELIKNTITRLKENTTEANDSVESALMSLLQNGLKSNSIEFSNQFKEIIWESIDHCLQSKSPDANEEIKNYTEIQSYDVYGTAINRVRPQAVENLIYFCSWYAPHDIPFTISSQNEISAWFDTLLDSDKEKSPAVRSMFGANIHRLYNLDADWLRKNIDLIFPLEENKDLLWQSAWYTFVAFQNPHKKVYEVLELGKHYEKALNQLITDAIRTSGPANPRDRIIEHILQLYWYEMNTDLVIEFYGDAKDEYKEHAMQYIGQVLPEKKSEENKVPESILKKIKDLIEERSKVACKEEFQNFWWIIKSGQFEFDFIIEILLNISQRSSRFTMFHEIVQFLEQNLAENTQDKILAFLENMLDKNDKGLGLGYQDANLKSLLSKVIKSQNTNIAEKAEDIVHKIGSLGYFEYEALLEVKSN